MNHEVGAEVSQETLVQEMREREITDVDRATQSLFSLLCSTRPKVPPSKLLADTGIKKTRFANLFHSLTDRGQIRQANGLRRWLFRAHRFPATAYFIRAYNENAGCSDAIMQAFLRDDNDIFPYPDVIIMTLLCYARDRIDDVNRALRSEKLNDWRSLIDDFVQDAEISRVIENLRFPLRYYGGGTHTILHLYDHYIRRLLLNFNRDAQFLGDLGGGYATSDINRATGLSFTSLDILPADIRRGDPEFVPLRKNTTPWAATFLNLEERTEYIEKQTRVPWINWNVLEAKPLNAVIGDYDSYGFISCGFLTSSVRPWSDLAFVSEERFNTTSKESCRRIVELVAAGKDVSLLAIERATAVIRDNKAFVLRWRDRRLISCEWMKNPAVNIRDGVMHELL